MKQFVKNNKPYAQTSREDFAQKYLAEGCLEVPVLYNGSFIDAEWIGILPICIHYLGESTGKLD